MFFNLFFMPYPEFFCSFALKIIALINFQSLMGKLSEQTDLTNQIKLT